MANIKTLSQTLPIVSFSDTIEPLWGDDTGRNSNSGVFSGTFRGYFTNLHIEFASTTKEEMLAIKSVFEVPIIENLTFPNSSTSAETYTENFYGTAIKSELDDWEAKYRPFGIDLVAVRPRNDI